MNINNNINLNYITIKKNINNNIELYYIIIIKKCHINFKIFLKEFNLQTN